MSSRFCLRSQTIHGLFRAAADLAEAMREILGDEFCAYFNKDLKKQLRKVSRGLQYYTKKDRENGIAHIGISSEPGSFSLQPLKLYGKPKRD